MSKAIKNIKQLPINKFLTKPTPDSSTDNSLWKVIKYLKRQIAQVPSVKNNMEDGLITT
jgi:hypothetical protein